jgi:hypothetical protein
VAGGAGRQNLNKHCFNVRISEDAGDEHPFTFSVTLGHSTSPEITAYHWNKEPLVTALRDAGLTEIRWVVPTPSPEGVERHGADFWADLIQRPFELIVTCRKACQPATKRMVLKS